MDAEWVRSIRDQCQKANVPFFFKQWGGINKGKTGKMLDGRVWNDLSFTMIFNGSLSLYFSGIIRISVL